MSDPERGTSRREFFQSSALLAAAASVGAGSELDSCAAGSGSGLPVPGLAGRSLSEAGRGIKWDKAPCRFCGTGCHVMVGVKNDRVVAIAGDRKAGVNRGLLCVKGYHVGLALYGKDRLTRPLLRQGGKLRPVSWDRALDVMADRVQKDPQGFAFYGSGQWTIPEGYAAQKLMKGGLSCNHIDPNARLCMSSAVTGFLATYGVDEPAGCYQDLDECDVLVFWGNNMAEMHPVLFSRLIDRRRRGQKVRLIDLATRRTRTTEHCQHYLEFKPHTDLAVANGVAHLLLERGTYDKEFVSRYCNFRKDEGEPSLYGVASSFAELERHLAEYTPKRVEALSGVPARDLRMLADLFGNPELRITSTWCMGMNQHTRGTAINSLVHGLHLLSGHFGRPGDSPTSLTGQPSACGTVREVGTLTHALPGGRVVKNAAHRAQAEQYWNLPPGRINATPGYHTVKMWERFCTPTAEGGDIHTIWVQVTNPGQSLPNLNRLFGPKKKLRDKFLIVSDVYPTATTALADLVLPSALWVEKNGMFGNSERRTQQWFRMVHPPGEARDDTWQTIALARRLYDRGVSGMKDKDGRFLFEMKDDQGRPVPVWDFARYYDVNVDQQLFEEYRQFSRLKHKDLAPYEEYVKTRGLRWPVVKKDGTWRETRFRFAGFDDPYVDPGKKIQFYHSRTGDDRAQIWLRPYEAPPESPDEHYPLWLCTGRVLEHWHTGTMTGRVPPLRRAVPWGYVGLNRRDAARYGVHNGDRVRVASRRGWVELRALIDGRGEPPAGSVFIPFFDEQRLVNRVTLHAFDPISKQPDYKKCAVRIQRLGPG